MVSHAEKLSQNKRPLEESDSASGIRQQILETLEKSSKEDTLAECCKILLNYMHLLTFQDSSEEFLEEISEVVQCASDYFEGKVEGEAAGEIVSVLTDIFLSLLTRSHSKHIVGHFVSLLAPHITKDAFMLIVNAVGPASDDDGLEEEMKEMIDEDEQEVEVEQQVKKGKPKKGEEIVEVAEEIPEGAQVVDFDEGEERDNEALQRLLESARLAQEGNLDDVTDIPIEQAKPEDLERIDNAIAQYMQSKNSSKEELKQS